MARIRTIKPEAFQSEDLASVELTAMVTFLGLFTQADDLGRFRDNAKLLRGLVWNQREEITSDGVAHDLQQLDEAGLICRYLGCDGKKYLHVVTWDKHQKIDRPSASRIPRCPHHQAEKPCGGCSSDTCPHAVAQPLPQLPAASLDTVPAPSPSLERTLDLSASTAGAPVQAGEAVAAGSESGTSGATQHGVRQPARIGEELAGQALLGDDSRGSSEGSASGSRILDPGSSLTGRAAPAPKTLGKTVSAKVLLSEYIAACQTRPPERFLKHLGRETKHLLDEDFAADTVRAAMERLRAKGLHPSTLASLVNEVCNTTASAASGAGPWASARPVYTPWMNPTDTSVYQEAL